MISISIPVSALIFLMISFALTASRIAEVAQAFKCFTSYTSSRYLYDLMVLMILSVLAAEISPLSNTSKPKRRGTRIRAIFMNSGVTRVPLTTSLINNLAALLPISMAANLTMLQSFFCEEMVGFDLGTYFLFSFERNIFIAQFIVEPSCFYIITQLDVQYVFQFLFDRLIRNGTSGFYTMIEIAHHPVCRRYINFLFAIIMKYPHSCMLQVLINNADSCNCFFEFVIFREHTKYATNDQFYFYSGF